MKILTSKMDALNQLIASRKYHELLSIIKGCRNGAVYGAKIRFPHALVMTLLFKRSEPKKMFKSIMRATMQHARNLATFVPIYKGLLLILSKVKNESQADPFIAGLIGGWFVFGADNPINNQIVLYLFSRVSVGLARLAVDNGMFAPTNSFPIFSAVTWGIVMWLFKHHANVLQPSLQSSMQYLYNDSDVFTNVGNWLLSNK